MPDPQLQTPTCHWRPQPRGFPTRREHQLRLNAWCNTAGITLTIAAVVVDDDGVMRPMVYTVLPTGNGALTQGTFTIEAGLLTSVHVFASAGTIMGAQCYVRVELVQGQAGGALTSVGTVCYGYVTDNVAVAYPGINARAVDGRGTFRSVTNAAPGVGTDFTVTVPTNRRWALQSIAYTLTAAPVVANRLPVLTIDDGANVLWEAFNNTAVTTGQVVSYRAGAGVQLGTIQALDFQLPLPTTLLLASGWRIRSVTGGLNAGDQFSQQNLDVEEWFDV